MNEKQYAFPDEANYGLTKREYFAAAAMQGLLAKASYRPNNVAKVSTQHADRLIEELEKEKQDDR